LELKSRPGSGDYGTADTVGPAQRLVTIIIIYCNIRWSSELLTNVVFALQPGSGGHGAANTAGPAQRKAGRGRECEEGAGQCQEGPGEGHQHQGWGDFCDIYRHTILGK
jgi:hypothetical protein